MQKTTAVALLLFAGMGLCLACSSSGESETATDRETAADTYKIFTYIAEGKTQALQLRWQNDTALTFVLEHRQGDCSYTLSGNAVNPSLNDVPESDTDPATGESYRVDLYLYKEGSCRMTIRLAQDTSKARLQLSNCNASPSCALESLGVLRREL